MIFHLKPDTLGKRNSHLTTYPEYLALLQLEVRNA